MYDIKAVIASFLSKLQQNFVQSQYNAPVWPGQLSALFMQMKSGAQPIRGR
jgi:hypothetical protein